MNKLFDAADRYIRASDWKTIAVLKFCLISLGLMAGMLIRPEHKKAVFPCALGVFFVTYVPLMAKFFRVFAEMREQEK
ncbi:MAG: permease of phosphate ABC transporter [Oscillospiraceae bacterium]|nr:permease of phosphate ABC transporter [Oscillospiraceae bacterium]